MLASFSRSQSVGNLAKSGNDEPARTPLLKPGHRSVSPSGTFAPMQRNPNVVDIGAEGEKNVVEDIESGRKHDILITHRFVPLIPPVQKMLETVCSDLDAYGESFVPNEGNGHTLVHCCSFIPERVNDQTDADLVHFSRNANTETYAKRIGLPGITWATETPALHDIKAMVVDPCCNPGGSRLKQASMLFHTALTIPLIIDRGGTKIQKGGFSQSLGVLVVYLPTPQNHISALMTYAESIAGAAQRVSQLMMHRALFIEGRRNRLQRNMRVMKIALYFLMPMLIRYHNRTGDQVTDTFEFLELKSDTPPMAEQIIQRRSPHRSPVIGGKVLSYTRRPSWMRLSDIDTSTAVLKRERSSAGLASARLLDLLTYGSTAKPVKMKKMPLLEACVTWVGTFCGIGATQVAFDILNSAVAWNGQGDLFYLTGSFGALATLLYALPAAPLAQPRTVLFAHLLGMACGVGVIYSFPCGVMVWLQKALAASMTISAMGLMGVIHPPAGALSIIFVGAANNTATNEQVVMLVLSVLFGLGMHISVAIGLNHLSSKRSYPEYWWE
ncbi:unnamed protein product [Choristocarpus tenellus]